MTEERVKRKLIAIFSADVEGYSRLMGEDEIWTIRTLESFRQIFAALIQKYRGRVVDSPGDNILAEFGSVVDAVQSAVEIQEALRSKNAEFPENRQMAFRIGINLGDVIEEGDKIYGDGVNIAARIEGLAEAGGICISGSAYEQIENKLALGYEYIGKHIVKNIRKPIHVYKVPVGFEPEASGRRAERRVKTRRLLWGTLLAAAILIIGGTVGHFILRPVYAPKDKVQKEEPEEKSLKAQLVFWETIKDSEDRKMYEEYLRKFPEGIFAGLAKLNVEKYSKSDTTQKKDSGRTKDKMHEKMLQGPQRMRQKPAKEEAALKKSPKEDYEIVFWRSIENSKNMAVFQEYLNRFPNGTFVGLAKIKIKDLAEDESKKIAALTKPKDEEKKKIQIVAEENLKFDTQPSEVSPKKTELVEKKTDAQIEETKKLDDIEKKKDEKQIALHRPQKKEVEKVIKTSQPLVQFRPENVIELAVFPWHVKLQFREGWGGISSKALKTGSIDGLKQFLAEYRLVIPKYSYYDLGEEIDENNIKGNLLTEDLVNALWTKKGFISKRQLNIELIKQLGNQLQVQAILMYDILYGPRTAEADIHLIDVEAKKIYSKTEGIHAITVRSDIKNLTEKLFFEYLSKRYQSHPNYELILWENIKGSQNVKVFQEYLKKFPDGTFAGLAELKIEKLSKKILDVAIFPWRFKLPQWYADPPPSLSACLNGIFDIIQKYDEIELKYSYYENKKFKRAKVETIKSVIENNEKDFWAKKSSSSDFQPNFDVIYDYGEQIRADLVLLTAIESSSIMENIKVYLVDINNKKIYEAVDRRPDRPLETFLALSEKTIENFLQKTKKAN